MRKLGRRYFYPARNRKATIINPVVSHSDTLATGRIRSKYRRHSLLTFDRSWQRSVLIPPARKKRDSGFLERRSRERSERQSLPSVYRRRYTSTALLGSVSPGVRMLLNHKIRPVRRFPPASIRSGGIRIPVSGPAVYATDN